MVANATDFSTDREGTAGTFDREPGKGFEPPTGRLQGGCSTSELPGLGGFRFQVKSLQLEALSVQHTLILPSRVHSGLPPANKRLAASPDA